jgi:putative ABC transport system permease protein
MTALFQDLKFGLRMLAKAPVVSGIAALSLATGIAANAAMFAILDGFLFEPLPYANQDELVLLREVRHGEGIEMSPGVSIPNYRDYVEASRSFSDAAAYGIDLQNLTGMDVPEELQVVQATPSLFDVLGVQPALGRGFRPEEGAQGLGNVVVLEHDFWQRRFLGDGDVLGRSITLDGTPLTVIGVMPEEFDMIPANVHAFRPTDFSDRMEERGSRGYIAMARLAPGATVERAEMELAGVASRLEGEFPEANRGWGLLVIGMRGFFPGPTDTKLVTILSFVTLFGLLIACANVANLLLGRAEERQKEVAVRTALGAGRGRILTQLLTESVTLGLVAGLMGIVMAVWVVGWLQGAMPPELPVAFMPELDPGVLLATLAVSVLAGIALGMAPAFTAAGGALREALGEGARGGTVGRRRKRIRNAFVVGEFAVALALLTGASFLIQSFNSLSTMDPGFDTEGLLTFRISVLEDRYVDDESVVAYQEELQRALGEIPGVEGVAVMASLPRGRGNPSARYTVVGRPAPEPSEQPTASLQSVNPAYFSTLEVDLRQGRLLEQSDRLEGQPVAVVSQAFVDREFPGEDPLGRSISTRGRSWMIVGVVENIMQDRIALAGDNGEAIYLPLAQRPLRNPSFALKTSVAEPATLAAAVRSAVWSVEADQPLARLRTFEDHEAESLAGPRAMSSFLTVMAVLALVLAAMGIYGVMAHAVAQQTREIGIRIALGAGRGSVVGMVTRSGMTLAMVGMLLGAPLVFLMYRGVLSALGLFEADITFTYAYWVTGALVTVAAVSMYLPARRASGVHPMVALKD